MLKTKYHIKGKYIFQQALLLAVLLVYLVVPFKNHFLNTAHFVSHIVLFESPVHSHITNTGGHSFSDFHEQAHVHEHHHGILELLSQSLNDFNKDKALPVELLTFRFQVEIPSGSIQLNHALFFLVRMVWKTEKSKILTGPYFDVPLPPP